MSSAGVVSYALITIFVIMVNSQTATWLVRVADHLPKSEGNAGKNYEGIAKSHLEKIGVRGLDLISLCLQRLVRRNVPDALQCGLPGASFRDMAGGTRAAHSEAHPTNGDLTVERKVLPLGLLRDISKLQCTSSLAVVSLGLTVAFIVYCNAEALHEHPHLGKGFQLVNIDSAFFLSLAMTNSSLSCHISVIPIYESLRGGDVKTMRSSAVVTEQVNPHTEPMKFTLAAIAGASVASSLILGMPVVLWALRSVLLSYARFHVRSSRGANGEISQLEWSLATLGLMMTILVLATAVPDIQLLVIAMSVVYGVLCLSISLRRVMSKLSEKDIELDASNSTSSEAWSSSVSIMW
eukprot:g13703.t1